MQPAAWEVSFFDPPFSKPKVHSTDVEGFAHMKISVRIQASMYLFRILWQQPAENHQSLGIDVYFELLNTV